MTARYKNARFSPACLLALAVVAAAFASGADARNACKDEDNPFLTELAALSAACSHPLCGKIYAIHAKSRELGTSCQNATAARFFVDALATLSSGGILILGEAHDNAIHHRLQAEAVRAFASSSMKPAVVFEQIRDNQQPGLDRFKEFNEKAARLGNVSDLKRLLEWDKSGWPKDLYDPLFEAAIGARLDIYPGDVSRPQIMKVAKEREAAVDAVERARLGLDVPLGAPLDAALVKEIAESHCGAIPASAFDGMAFAQRYRDAHLADAALRAAEGSGSAILITGTAHARTDRGVPWYVHHRAPENEVVSLMFVEVDEGRTDADSYVPRSPESEPAADYVVFTPRDERPDPCEKMRAK